MADCVACGSRLEDGITRCPSCEANLERPGALLLIGGWVLFFASSIPIILGVNAARQNNYVALAIGLAACLLGVMMVLLGRAKIAASPNPVRPSAPPAAPPPGGIPAGR
jgi:hypothetical protein